MIERQVDSGKFVNMRIVSVLQMHSFKAKNVKIP